MISADHQIACPLPLDFDLHRVEGSLRQLQLSHPISFKALAATGRQMDLEPSNFALLFETVELGDRDGSSIKPVAVWNEAASKYCDIMKRAVREGASGRNRTSFLKGDWGTTLAGRASLLGPSWNAFVGAVAVQEFNAGMGLVSAAPTGGASGTVPGTLVAVSDAIGVELSKQVASLFVAGLVGRVAFGRGPVSGAQAGCGGEVGIAAGMAAGGVAYLLGGSWEQIDAAASLAGTPFVGLECSPTQGLVEYPCVPRNGFAALCAIAAAEAACAGIVPPYGLDETFDRIFGIGRLLPGSLRETNDGDWAAPACRTGGCNRCGSK
jgi:L-serine deaminase